MTKREKKSSTADSEGVACPYFITHSESTIVCRSDLPDASATFKFQDEETKKIQKEVFCEQHYKKCPHYFAVFRWGWE